jgi:hypothetical protein
VGLLCVCNGVVMNIEYVWLSTTLEFEKTPVIYIRWKWDLVWSGLQCSSWSCGAIPTQFWPKVSINLGPPLWLLDWWYKVGGGILITINGI